MDPKYTGEMWRHLEKQNELLMDSYKSLSHELHKLQIEEEMLMRKFYELMAAEGANAQKEGGKDIPDDSGHSLSKALVNVSSSEKR